MYLATLNFNFFAFYIVTDHKNVKDVFQSSKIVELLNFRRKVKDHQMV